MKVAIIFDAGSEDWSPQDVAAVVANVHEVRDVLRAGGPRGRRSLPVRLGDFRWLSRVRRADLVFNLCEGVNGHARFEDLRRRRPRAHRRAVHRLPSLGRPPSPTGSTSPTPCSPSAGVPVPAFTLAQATRLPTEFPLPAIVKPAAEDASVGIDNGAVCTSQAGAQEARRAHARAVRRGAGPGIRAPAGSSTSGSSAGGCCPIAEIRFDHARRAPGPS